MTDETKKPDSPAPAAPADAPAAAKPSAAPAAAPAAAAPRPAAPAAPKPPVHKGPVARVVTNPLCDAVGAKLGDKVEGVPSIANEATLKVKAHADLYAALEAAKAAGADYCSDVTSAHYPKDEAPFEVIYHLFSLATNQSLRIKARLKDGEAIPSCVPLWPGAEWMEREIYDLMGVTYTNHPDLRRILTPEDWDWHPLRKDYNRFGPDWVNKLRGGEARARYDERGVHYAKQTAPEAFIEEPPAPKPAPAASSGAKPAAAPAAAKPEPAAE